MKNLRWRKLMAAVSSIVLVGLFAASGLAHPDDSGPLAVIDGGAIAGTGVDNVLQLLERFDTGFSGSGNRGAEYNAGGAGESYAALRNLDTLVLLDGRRLAVSPFSSINSGLAPSVDLNVLPLAMIDHVEILKDGASAAYGSGAIGGVVNVITKKDFNGAEVYGGYGSSSDRRYRDRTYGVVAGISAGVTSVTFDVDFYGNPPLKADVRSIAGASLRQIAAFGGVPGSTGAGYYSGTYPGRVGSDILAGSPLAAGASGYRAAVTTPPVRTNAATGPDYTLTQLEAMGVYIPLGTTPLYTEAGGPVLLNTTQFGSDSVEPSDRRQFLMNFGRKLSGGALEFDASFLYAQTTNGGSVLDPAPLASLGSSGLSIPADNPYNPFGIALGVGQPAGAPDVRNRLVEIGDRGSKNKTDTGRVVAELKGEVAGSYHWDLSADYGRASTVQQFFGGANAAVLNALLVPRVNPDGSYVPDPSTGRPLSAYVDPGTGAADLPVFNYFGLAGSNDPRTLKAIRTILVQNGVTQLEDYQAVFTGSPFALPAGRLSFSAGGAYTRQSLAASANAPFASGAALGYAAASPFAGGTLADTAVFGEIGLPIFSPSFHFPALHGLDATLAGRYEKLGTGPHASAPKFGLVWRPIDESLTIRGTYSKDFVSPSMLALYGPAQGSAPVATLPAGDGRAGSGGALPGAPVTGQFFSASEVGNPGLPPSISETATLGFVCSPPFLKGLTVSADYYHIHQDRVGGPDYTGLFASLNALGAASPYASGFRFADGSLLIGNAPNQVTSTNAGTLTVADNPSGTRWTDGLDVDAAWVLPIDLGKITVGANANILFHFEFRPSPSDPFLEYARQFTSDFNAGAESEGLLPGYQIKPYASWALRHWKIRVDGTYIPTVTDSGTLFGDPRPGAVNSETANGGRYTIPSYWVANVSVGYDFGKNPAGRGWSRALRGVSVVLGANDVFNKLPPYVPSSTEDNTDKINYSIVGAFYFMRVSKTF